MFRTVRFVLLVNALVEALKPEAPPIRQVQEKRFRQLLRHAYRHSPFYQRRFRGLDLDRCSLGDLPPMGKKEMMANYDEVVTDRRVRRQTLERFMADPANLGRRYLGRYIPSHTSGSQGQPALIVQEPRGVATTVALQMARGNNLPKEWTTVFRRLLRRARWALVTLRPDFYPSAVAFAYLPAGARRLMRLEWSSLFDPLKEMVARLNAFQPEYLTGYANVLETLAREEEAGRLRLRATGTLLQLANISEPMAEETRLRLEAAFGVHASNQYAMGECPHLTVGCPVGPGSHLNADLAILEVVDDQYRAVPPGTAGSKVLVTNLVNRIQPFIRYEIDDVVTMSPGPCPCGSPLPLIRPVPGRAQDRLWVEMGGRVRELPVYAFRAGLQHFTSIGEYQISQTGPNRYEVQVAPVPGQSLDSHTIRSRLLESLSEEGVASAIELETRVVADIQPDPRSGKLKRVRNLVEPPLVPLAATRERGQG